MAGVPFVVFYMIGMIFQSNLDYLIKLVSLVTIYLGIYFANHFVFDERLCRVLPISIYLATKVSELLTLDCESLFCRLEMINLAVVDIRDLGILVGHTRGLVPVVTPSRWVRSSVDMFPAVLERQSRNHHGLSRGKAQCTHTLLPAPPQSRTIKTYLNSSLVRRQ